MLRFDKSKLFNTNAAYLDTVSTAEGYYDSLRVVYSQSYDQSSGLFPITVTSTPTDYRNYLVFTNTPDVLPNNSGQYDIEIYTTVVAQSDWNEVEESWISVSSVWSNVEEGIDLIDLLYSDRAFISGSNESSITQYSSPNEDGKYTTYNG